MEDINPIEVYNRIRKGYRFGKNLKPYTLLIINDVLDHFISVEDYDKCSYLRDYIKSIIDHEQCYYNPII